MLNIWGVILYLRLPWITAQAGIGECPLKEKGCMSAGILVPNPLGCRDCRLGLLLPSTPSDGSSHGWGGAEETVGCRVIQSQGTSASRLLTRSICAQNWDSRRPEFRSWVALSANCL